MNARNRSVLFTREPAHRRVALRCGLRLTATVAVITLMIYVSDGIPEPARKVCAVFSGMALFGFWVVGFFFSIGSLLCRERRPLFAALLLLFYVATAAIVILAPLRGGAIDDRENHGPHALVL